MRTLRRRKLMTASNPERSFRIAPGPLTSPLIETSYPASRAQPADGIDLATSRSLEFGDLLLLPGQLPCGEQAAAMPTGFSLYPAQKRLGVHALRVGFVGECVSARCRES